MDFSADLADLITDLGNEAYNYCSTDKTVAIRKIKERKADLIERIKKMAEEEKVPVDIDMLIFISLGAAEYAHWEVSSC